jgi:tetratricopeptide (TPR) repeat protein
MTPTARAGPSPIARELQAGLALVAFVRIFVCLLLFGVVQSGCASHTTDLTRPIMVDRAKLTDRTVVEALAAYHGKQDREELKKWLDPVRTVMVFFTLSSYGEYPFEIRSLAEVLQQSSENPYGWIYLGMFLALQHRTDAAIEATWEGIRQLDAMRQRDPRVFALVADFYVAGLLNLGIYYNSYNSLERYGDALQSLEKIDESTLNAFQRLAYYWISAQTFSGLRNTAKADTLLKASLTITDAQLARVPHSTRDRYPQYFNPERRSASWQHLDGLLALDRGDFVAAQKAFRAAIAKYPKMWEAHYSLSNALVAAGMFEAARGALRELLEKTPNDGYFRSEVLYFSLGNIDAAEKRLDDAIAHYQAAINLAQERAQEYCMGLQDLKLDPATSVGRLLQRTLEPANESFAEAENNLANMYFDKFRRGDFTGEKLKEVARLIEKLYRRAAANETYRARHVAIANLARFYWYKQQYDVFLMEMQRAVRLRPGDVRTLEQLFYLSDAVDDVKVTISGFAIVIDTLLELGISERGSQLFFETMIRRMRERLEAFPESLGQARALSRLYFLSGDTVKNQHLLQETVNTAPTALFVLVGLARLEIERDSGGFGKARDLLDRAIATGTSPSGLYTEDIDRRDAFYLRARVRTKQGEYEGAREDFEQTLKISPDWSPAKLGLRSLPLGASR